MCVWNIVWENDVSLWLEYSKIMDSVDGIPDKRASRRYEREKKKDLKNYGQIEE
jgi:hypothetical protein